MQKHAHHPSANRKFGQAFRLFVATFLCGVAYACYATQDYYSLLVCSPFSVLLVPGYLNMLPEKGMRHGFRCDCREFDEACEFGFWLEVGQKLLLVFPIVMTSITLYYYFVDKTKGMNEIVSALVFAAQCATLLIILILALIFRRRF